MADFEQRLAVCAAFADEAGSDSAIASQKQLSFVDDASCSDQWYLKPPMHSKLRLHERPTHPDAGQTWLVGFNRRGKIIYRRIVFWKTMLAAHNFGTRKSI